MKEFVRIWFDNYIAGKNDSYLAYQQLSKIADITGDRSILNWDRHVSGQPPKMARVFVTPEQKKQLQYIFGEFCVI